MSQTQKLRCALMGSHSRLIKCGDILLEKGNDIVVVIAAEPEITSWAQQKRLRLLDPAEDLPKALRREPFDIFLSIDNFAIVPDQVLCLAKKYAINFHDGPLPTYAGINATNWALLSRERQHGVSWHLMSQIIDGGDILKQAIFPVSPNETALSLNSKCYEHSLRLFAELADDLAEGRVTARPQDLTRRTYFGMWQRPPAACTIDWHSDARDIDALCRALDHGTYPNPLGIPKLYLGKQVMLVPNLRVSEDSNASPPGTITHLGDDQVQIATTDGEVAIDAVFTFDGRSLSAAKVVAKSGFHCNDQLPMLTPEQTNRLTRIHAEVCRHERFWQRSMETCENFQLPYSKPQRLNAGQHYWKRVSFGATPKPTCNESTRASHLFAGSIAYLFRASGKKAFSIAFQYEALREKLHDIEAFFAAELPVRIEVEPWEDFGRCEARVRAQIETARNHGTYLRDLPVRVPSLKKALRQHGSWSVPVAFQCVRSLSEVASEPITTAADLAIVIDDYGECEWWYNDEAFEQHSISLMQEQVKTLLDDAIARPYCPVSELSIVPAEERDKVIRQWNATHVDYAHESCLHKLFESRVQRSPDRVALEFSGTQLTYSELNAQANRLAHHLRRLGVRPDTLVAVCMERSLELVIALYAVLKAGGAYVPVDPEYPEERISFMLQDCSAPVLLTQRKLISLLPPYKGTVLPLDAEWETIAQQEDVDPVNLNGPNDLAYVIYTSGSTGRPKGAMNTHRGICNRLLWMQDQYRLTMDDKILQKTPFSFDVSVWEFFWPLLFGARIVVSHPGGHRDPAYLIRLIAGQQITVLHFVPSMLRIFLEEPGVERCRSLRRVICSGEALPFSLQQRFFDLLDCPLHNLYGPTETAVDVTHWTCERDSKREIVPIGRPVANTQIYILDRYFQPVPVGLPGELFIAGVQVGRGYHNRPELTAEKFLPDPFSAVRGERMYRTGDLCRWLPDGVIEYLGRLDHQVKIHGLRVELGEIESAILRHHSVRNCCVVARDTGTGEKQLIAYVAAQPDTVITPEELRHELRRSLPEYMVPAAFLTIDEIPLLPNGKVDHRALSALAAERTATPDALAVPPANEMERKIAAIWHTVLETTSVGVNDNFFDIGGDSLRLLDVRARLRHTLGIDVPIVDLFLYTSIRALVQHLTVGLDRAVVVPTDSEVTTRKTAARERMQMRRQARIS